ncbi:MAG TPA: phenylalanine--tRNA ligase subunit alpha [Acidobacteriota bacterium]|nr:phenylalanine--tRNA ligase subunit alpha [Acidobacteriota bacterium]
MSTDYSAQIQTIVPMLHEYERLVLPVLLKTTDLSQIQSSTKLDEVRVSRALQWLSNKELVSLSYDKFEIVDLDINGKKYAESGFPETQFLKTVASGEEFSLPEIQRQSNLSSQEVGVCMGLLKSKGFIESSTTNKGLLVKITASGKEAAKHKTEFDAFVNGVFPRKKSEFSQKDLNILEQLQRRNKIVIIDRKQSLQIKITQLGIAVAKSDLTTNQVINTLTPAILKSGEWKGKQFRPFDVNARVPQVQTGRIHPMSAVIQLVRDIFTEMGFVEMKGPWVETAFWCMDSMWIPQDHPARDVQDTFYLNKSGNLPDKVLTDKVAQVHQTGQGAQSKGYGYVWDPKLASQLILRTHTTATTFRMFGEQNLKPPAKYFCIDRVFRNEAIDATHLPEFHQVEGFVMAEGLTLADLLGFIKEFYAKLGFHNIKFKPTYNPYTESSVEAFYYDERRKAWMELINSGIFRPESLAPYGIKVPVIAWGMGLERLAMIMLEQNKLKDIIGPTTDIKWLRSYKIPKRA